MNKVYLLLGGNIGDRIENIELAKAEISRQIGTIIKESSYYESEPWGFDDEKPFINQVILIDTELKATQLLEKNQDIEKELGRIKKVAQYTSRNIDIDILFYERQIIFEKGLIIPHSQLHKRRFTLLPLAEIASDLVHPVFKKQISEMLENCKDELSVSKLNS